MRKLLPFVLLIVLLISGCQNTGSTAKNNETAKAPNKIESEGKGFENIERIEIVKFSYDKQRSYQSKKTDKTVIIENTNDIKKFIEIFNKKEISSGIYNVLPMDYQLSIIKKDGSKEVYDLAYSESQVFFHDNGTGYFITNADTAKEFSELMKKVGFPGSSS